MAFTERYVTSGAGGGGSGTSGSPWTFAEAIANAVAGDRVNIQSDAGYSIGVTTFGAGTFSAPIIWRGYNATIGDCDDLGRNADGTLNTTGMPVITITGNWTMAPYVTLQNLNITGALSGVLIGDTTVDFWNMISCRVENTQNNAAATAVTGDDNHTFINCDMICSGAAHNRVHQSDVNCRFIDCRFEITAAANCIETQTSSVFVGCVFLKNGSLGGDGIEYDVAVTSTAQPLVIGCTFYNLANALYHYSAHSGGVLVVHKCHATDCTKFIDNGTNIACYLTKCRTRDNTSPPSTLEAITVGAITTDAGDETTDFTDASTNDLHLKITAAGYNAGWDGSDIGGLQTDPPASSGGALHLGGLGQTGIGVF